MSTESRMIDEMGAANYDELCNNYGYLSPADERYITRRNLEDELNNWEAALKEAQEELDIITAPDYTPAEPDYYDQDVENLEAEINEAEKNIKRITARLERIK